MFEETIDFLEALDLFLVLVFQYSKVCVCGVEEPFKIRLTWMCEISNKFNS